MSFIASFIRIGEGNNSSLSRLYVLQPRREVRFDLRCAFKTSLVLRIPLLPCPNTFLQKGHSEGLETVALQGQRGQTAPLAPLWGHCGQR